MENLPIQTVDELIETFDLMDDWEEKYEFLIDLGRKLPPLSDEVMQDCNIVQGCQSRVWLVADVTATEPPQFEIQAGSDAQIVRGLVAILLIAYQGKTPQEVLDFDMEGLFQRLGFVKGLSRSRSNGLFSMVKRVRDLAQRQLIA